MYKLGQVYYSVGIDGKGRRVITKVKLMEVRAKDARGFDCVTRSGGMNMLDTLDSLYERREDIKL